MNRKHTAFWSIFIACAVLLMNLAAPASLAADKKKRGVTASLVVNAPPPAIWNAILGLRNKPGSNVQQLERDDKHSILQENFYNLPLVGTATCTYREDYDVNHRLDYHLLKSDKFKAYEGSWVITPTSDASSNNVTLSTYVDTGLRLPFARQLTDASSKNAIQKRLQDVKKTAESK